MLLKYLIPLFLITIACRLRAEVETAQVARQLSSSGLEQKLEEIDQQLERLARYRPDSNVRSIGYRSAPQKSAHDSQWIKVNFEKAQTIDEVVLVPCLRRDHSNQLQPEAFPARIRIIAGNGSNDNGQVVAEISDDMDRIAPLIIPCGGVTANWLRIEATELSKRSFDGNYVFQLSELMVFSSEQNLALRHELQYSSSSEVPGWHARYATDGFVPYLMDSADNEGSIAYLRSVSRTPNPSITIDLGSSQPVSQINLHSIDLGDSLPQAFASNFSVPEHLEISGANTADFSDAKILTNFKQESIYDTGPILKLPFNEISCRYIKLHVLKPGSTNMYGGFPEKIGFAEIEILSSGKNIALNCPLTASFTRQPALRPLSLLTDGANMNGRILALREWMQQLSRRHELELLRPVFAQELATQYSKQKSSLQIMAWLIAILLTAIGFIILVNRMLQQRAIHRTRERIAADLHDELGANLHAISLLSDYSREAKDDSKQLDHLLVEMRALAERTAAATKYCTDLLESKFLCTNLAVDMRRTAGRIVADLDHSITIEDEALLERIPARKRTDIFLFYKESLTNIIRHSGATEVKTHLSVNKRELKLSITDNGSGIKNSTPAALKRRARLLKGQLNVEHPRQGGTRIILTLKPKLR